MSIPECQLEAEIRGFFPKPHKAIGCLATVDAARQFTPEVRTMTLLELDWCFYVATSAGTRKAREMTAHAKAAALITFQGGGFSGYLRVSGTAEPLDDITERKRIADTAAHNLECRWKGGAGDPDLAFFRIVPERIEYLRPGDEAAKDVTAELLPRKIPE